MEQKRERGRKKYRNVPLTRILMELKSAMREDNLYDDLKYMTKGNLFDFVVHFIAQGGTNRQYWRFKCLYIQFVL